MSEPIRVAVIDDGRGIGKQLAKQIGLASVMAIALSPGVYSQLPRLPAPKPAKRLTDADLERIEAAEAKRQRRIQRNQQRSS